MKTKAAQYHLKPRTKDKFPEEKENSKETVKCNYDKIITEILQNKQHCMKNNNEPQTTDKNTLQEKNKTFISKNPNAEDTINKGLGNVKNKNNNIKLASAGDLPSSSSSWKKDKPCNSRQCVLEFDKIRLPNQNKTKNIPNDKKDIKVSSPNEYNFNFPRTPSHISWKYAYNQDYLIQNKLFQYSASSNYSQTIPRKKASSISLMKKLTEDPHTSSGDDSTKKIEYNVPAEFFQSKMITPKLDEGSPRFNNDETKKSNSIFTKNRLILVPTVKTTLYDEAMHSSNAITSCADSSTNGSSITIENGYSRYKSLSEARDLKFNSKPDFHKTYEESNGRDLDKLTEHLNEISLELNLVYEHSKKFNESPKVRVISHGGNCNYEKL